jgi:hypothetical protein
MKFLNQFYTGLMQSDLEKGEEVCQKSFEKLVEDQSPWFQGTWLLKTWSNRKEKYRASQKFVLVSIFPVFRHLSHHGTGGS